MGVAREEGGGLPVVGYGEVARTGVSDWTMIVFGYALLELGAVAWWAMGAGAMETMGPYVARVGGLACLMAPVSFVAAAANCVWHFDQRPRPRWTWMPVCSVVLTMVSPVVPMVVVWFWG